MPSAVADGFSPSSHPLKIFDICKKQDKFLYACAPMVRYSKLAFRQTVHHYGTDLCWTPMILAKEFNRNQFARDSDLTISTNGPQPPTIVQFGANSPLELSRAASLAAPAVNGVDLNCGCPQSWACAETLGAALMNERALVRDMVIETRSRLERDGWGVGMEKDIDNPQGRSVSVKIRVHDDLRRTMDFLDTVIGDPNNRLVDWVTIHPRTRQTPSTTPIRTEALEILTTKYSKILPVLLSGDIFDINSLPFTSYPSSDPSAPSPPTTARPSNTGLSGFMSARGLLANPALFDGHSSTPWEAVEYFMCRVMRAPIPLKLTVHHLGEMCGPGMGSDKHALLSRRERAGMTQMEDLLELIDFLDEKMLKELGREMRRDL